MVRNKLYQERIKYNKNRQENLRENGIDSDVNMVKYIYE